MKYCKLAILKILFVLFLLSPAFGQSNFYNTALEDISFGNVNSEVVVVEYTSLTCAHCEVFRKKVFPVILDKYIKTQKIRYIIRIVSNDTMSAAAHMLVRCSDQSIYFDLINYITENRKYWTSGSIIEKLWEIMKQTKMSRENFNVCLKDEKLLDKIVSDNEHALNRFHVQQTPTIFVNGIKLVKAGNSGLFLEDGILKKGTPSLGSNFTIVRNSDNSLESIVKAIEKLL